MSDTYNLGWKLASVIQGSAPLALLNTYSAERQAKAKELIDFDREMAHTFSTTSTTDVFQKYFSKHARYTAGVETRYEPSIIVGPDTYQSLATGFRIGTRFHSAPVVRLADAKPLHLGHTVEADGRWRIFVFAPDGDKGQHGGATAKLAAYLRDDPASPCVAYTPKGADADSIIDVRAVFQTPHQELAFDQMPLLLRPKKGRFGLVDYEKIFCPDFKSDDLFETRRIARKNGAVLVIRPDQYVAHVLPLEATAELASFLSGCLQSPNG